MKEKYKTVEQSDPLVSKTELETPKTDLRSGNETHSESNAEVGAVVEVASNMSDLSGSTGYDESRHDANARRTATANGDAKEFEILIQTKHAEACKAMGVSRGIVLVVFV